MPDRNVERVAKLDTATRGYALEATHCRALSRHQAKSFRLAGRAYTILFGPLDADKPGTVIDGACRNVHLCLSIGSSGCPEFSYRIKFQNSARNHVWIRIGQI